MKKWIAIMLAGVLSVSMLAGCSSREVKEEAAATEEEDEENYETGDASLDNPRNQDDIGEKELAIMDEIQKDFTSNVFDYTQTDYKKVNDYLRKGQDNKVDKSMLQLKETMKKRPLTRDLVVRRGVQGVNTMAHMLGLPNAAKIKEKDLKNLLKGMSKSGKEIIVTEKGFMSTSLPFAENMFEAGNKKKIGIEFIILAKKGTAAVDIHSQSRHRDEGEVLFAPGTKFKVVDMQLDGDAEIIHGNEKSWKIYLASIPVNEKGVKKKVA